MLDNKIKFKAGYKYQLFEDFRFKIKIPISKPLESDWLKSDLLGNILVKKGYCWDGATCAIDTDNFMRGALVHDVLYQLIREGVILNKYREHADDILIRILEIDGMSFIRRFYVKQSLNMFGAIAASPSSKRKVLIAPK